MQEKYYFCIIKRITLILVLAFLALSARAQFTDSTTGLLSAPSADMYDSGTFFITNNYLNQQLLPPSGWDYSTFAYGFGITFWSRLEVLYACTLFWGDIWDSRFQAMFELQNFQWVSFGLGFKLRLKGSE